MLVSEVYKKLNLTEDEQALLSQYLLNLLPIDGETDALHHSLVKKLATLNKTELSMLPYSVDYDYQGGYSALNNLMKDLGIVY